MKKPHRITMFALTLALPLLSGCNIYDLFAPFNSFMDGLNSNVGPGVPDHSLEEVHINDFDGYYQPDGVNKSISYQALGQYNEDPYMPSTGDLNILVVPIEFSDFPFSQSTLNDIKTLTSGTSKDTNYWESLSSYYQKSSYGSLNLNFTYMDKVNVGTVASFTRGLTEDDESLQAGVAMEKAVSAYKRENGNASTQKFDSDKDGYIDAVIMIYSAPNYTNSFTTKNHKNLFWAYCYADYYSEEKPNVNSPVGWRYFWASYDFFYEATGTPLVHSGVDAHTLIHETGHLMGSDDLYNVSDLKNDIAEPSGSLLMMAWNVGDHDPFTKLSFGWTKPYVVTGDCTIQIRPSQSSGDCILLADNWNGTSFDEYVLIDFYTPTGLSEQDASVVYPEYSGKTRETAYRSSGIRVFHVDSRLCYGAGFDNDGAFMASGYLSDSDIANFSSFHKTVRYEGKTYLASVAPAISNSVKYDATIAQNKGFELLQIVQRGKTNTTRSGSVSTSADLFQKGDTFSAFNYSAFFPNNGKLNNGNALPYSFTVDDIGSDGAILSFKKL